MAVVPGGKQVTIKGKKVVFKDKLPAKLWWPLLPKLIGLTATNWLEVLDFETVCQIITGSVDSWEFEGDPSDPKAVEELDAFDELLPMLLEFSSILPDRVSPKEAMAKVLAETEAMSKAVKAETVLDAIVAAETVESKAE